MRLLITAPFYAIQLMIGFKKHWLTCPLVWCQEDYQSIRKATRAILPYGKFFHSGIFGGGLSILSKWPIEESSMLRYPLNGRPTAFFRGDWYVGKGVAQARIRIGSGPKDIVEVFSTHVCLSGLSGFQVTDYHTASCPLRTRTKRFLHMPQNSASMGNSKTYARSS